MFRCVLVAFKALQMEGLVCRMLRCWRMMTGSIVQGVNDDTGTDDSDYNHIHHFTYSDDGSDYQSTDDGGASPLASLSAPLLPSN